MTTEELQRLYQEYTGVPAENITELPSSGSNRRYFRLTGAGTLIGICGTSVEGNDAFLYMAAYFHKSGLPVPEVRIVSENKNYYLQEDLGDTLLFHAIEKGRTTGIFSEKEKKLPCKTVRLFPAIQSVGADSFDFSRCYPQLEFNQHSILQDLNHSRYYFFKATGMEFQEDKLGDDFQKMSGVLLRSSSAIFMYRDLQGHNAVIKDSEPWFIDFQGGRKGPFYYNVASLLWQVKAKYPDSLRQELLKEYIDALHKYRPIDEPYFCSQPRRLALFHTLQILGAYSFKGYFEKKPHFVQSVPFVIQNLRGLLKEAYPEYPYLCDVLRELTELKQLTDDLRKRQLTVKVMSFAYKKGIPDDPTNNGGGYVFDCHAVNNPGECECCEPPTGLDEPVISSLKEDGEILRFLDSVYTLVDASVKQYMERDFSNLSVCFGCTGGQHRSVCSAQYLAEHLDRKLGMKVELVYREQNIEHTFEATI